MRAQRGGNDVVVSAAPCMKAVAGCEKPDGLSTLSQLPKKGLEPPRPCGHWYLKPARLPIPPPGRSRRRFRTGASEASCARPLAPWCDARASAATAPGSTPSSAIAAVTTQAMSSDVWSAIVPKISGPIADVAENRRQREARARCRRGRRRRFPPAPRPSRRSSRRRLKPRNIAAGNQQHGGAGPQQRRCTSDAIAESAHSAPAARCGSRA